MADKNQSRRQVLKTGIMTAAGAVALNAVPALSFGQQGGGAATVQQIATSDPYSVAQGLYGAAMAPMTDGYLPSLLETQVAYLNLSTVASQYKAVAMQNGVNVNATVTLSDGSIVPMYDWSVPSYDDFVAAEMVFLPEVTEYLALNPIADVPTDFSWHYWLSKLLAMLGLGEGYKAFLDVLDDMGKVLMGQIGTAIKRKAWSWLKDLLIQLLNLIKSTRFKNKLIEKLGAGVAEKLIGKVLAKEIPVIGWAIFVGEMVWTVGEQYYKLIVSDEITWVHA